MIALFVPGKPVAFARAGTNGQQRYTPAVQAAYAQAVAWQARSAMKPYGGELFPGPVEVAFRATYAYPAKWSEKRRAQTRWRTAKSDVDNLAKLALDAMTGIVFRDDAQVARLTAEKVYGQPEGITVSVMRLFDDHGEAS